MQRARSGPVRSSCPSRSGQQVVGDNSQGPFLGCHPSLALRRQLSTVTPLAVFYEAGQLAARFPGLPRQGVDKLGYVTRLGVLMGGTAR